MYALHIIVINQNHYLFASSELIFIFAESMEVENQELQKSETPKEKTPEKDTKPSTQKIDTFMKFKTPSQKSPKKQKIDVAPPKTPVKIDILEEVAMSSWSDNSNTEIIKPRADAMDVDSQPSEKPCEVIQIEDSEDMKLVYDETETTQGESQSPKEAIKSPAATKSPKISPNVAKSGDSNFLKQAKVTDIKEPAVKSVPSPKAPRRVSFVTLSSAKPKKK